jgi:hypothetical protein
VKTTGSMISMGAFIARRAPPRQRADGSAACDATARTDPPALEFKRLRLRV